MGRGEARLSNHTKRRKDYKWFWRTLKDCGLWENSTFGLKQELGCMIDDVREVMPHCVIKDVRERWPNPPNVPYQGHRRSWGLTHYAETFLGSFATFWVLRLVKKRKGSWMNWFGAQPVHSSRKERRYHTFTMIVIAVYYPGRFGVFSDYVQLAY